MIDIPSIMNQYLNQTYPGKSIYRRAIIDKLYDNWHEISNFSSSHPEFTCIAGLPGAGKSEFVRRKRYSDSCAIIEIDNLRKYMPGYDNLSSENLISETGVFANTLSLLLIWAAIYAKSPIVITCTFTAVSFWEELFSQLSTELSARNYTTKLIILNQPNEESIRGMNLRMNSTSAEEPISRPVDMLFWREKLSLFETSMDYFSKSGFFGVVSILKRKKLEEEYLSVL